MSMSKNDVHDAIVCALERLRAHAAGNIDTGGELTQSILEIEAVLPVLEVEAKAETKAEEDGEDENRSAYALVEFAYFRWEKAGRSKRRRTVRMEYDWAHLGGEEGESMEELAKDAATVAARMLLDRRDEEGELIVEIDDINILIDDRPESEEEKSKPSDEAIDDAVKAAIAGKRREARLWKAKLKKGELVKVTLPDGREVVLTDYQIKSGLSSATDLKKKGIL